MQTPPPPTNYPRSNPLDDRSVLKEVAVAQRQVMYCVLGQVCVGILNGVATATSLTALALFDGVLALALLVFMIISVVKLVNALGLSAVLWVILMFVPCVSLIALLMLSQKATTRLQQAGIKVGLMGADPNSI
ncbi:MAG TPA: hypothetical protein VG944_03170 [Fimbriimonas sp.]|nr:hypothetical protein [Fimbriimonas sp.]